MSWTAITVADLNDARAGKLVDALRTKALADGQTDPTPRITQLIVNEVRRCIAFCPSTPVDADTTKVPDGLKGMTVQKIIREMKGRLMMALTDDEKDQERTYQKRLEQLTKGDWPVDKPDTVGAEVVQPKSGVQLASSAPRQVTHSNLSGL